MTTTTDCTCPSGDGSLRWPCPHHTTPEPDAADYQAEIDACTHDAMMLGTGVMVDGRRIDPDRLRIYTQSAAREPGGEDAVVALGDMPAPIRNPESWPANYAAGWNDCLRNIPGYPAYGIPYPAALRTRTPAPAVIDDAMVERAVEAFCNFSPVYSDDSHAMMRAALTAALAPEQGNNDG